MAEKVKDKIMRLEREIEAAHKQQDALRNKLDSLYSKFVNFSMNSGLFSTPSEAVKFLENYTQKINFSNSTQLKFNFVRDDEKR